MQGISGSRRQQRSGELWEKQTSLKSKTEAKRFPSFLFAAGLWFKDSWGDFSTLRPRGTGWGGLHWTYSELERPSASRDNGDEVIGATRVACIY